jgi:uncharacterized protein
MMQSAIPPFTEVHAAVLRNFLSSPLRPQGTMTYPQLAGFLFTMANAPELVAPSEWIPIVFNDHEALYETPEEAERVLQAMMALYNDCGRERPQASGSFPPGCESNPHPLDNLLDDAPLSHWAQGFSIGYDYLEEIWDRYIPEELDEDLGAALMVLTFFSSPKLARAYHEEAGKGSFEQLAETVVSIFPDAMREYAFLARSIYQARLETGDLGPEPSRSVKNGPNDPCPCGSGKKFKKCCSVS